MEGGGWCREVREKRMTQAHATSGADGYFHYYEMASQCVHVLILNQIVLFK